MKIATVISVWALLAMLVGANRAAFGASEQDYMLAGEMTFTLTNAYTKGYSETQQCEIQRNGEQLVIKTSLHGSRYPISMFVCDSTNSFTCVQYEADELANAASTGSPKPRNVNKASVWVSMYPMPKYLIGKLTPLWLMAGGNENYSWKDGKPWIAGKPWINVFGNRTSFEFYDQPLTTPEVSVSKSWRDGFSDYFERIEMRDTADPSRTIIQEGTFKIQTWTNYNQTIFPKGFDASVKRYIKMANGDRLLSAEETYAFTVTQVGDLPSEELATRAPVYPQVPPYSEIADMRPREQGEMPTGVQYLSANGIIYSEPNLESKKGVIHTVPALGSGNTPKIPQVNNVRRIIVLCILVLIVSFPAFLLVQKKRWFSKSHRE